MKVKKEKIEHINYALVAKAHTPMYLMHKFWARKPHNVVAEYIKHYSKPGDIVFDPFCGSGPTPIESLKLERRAIAIDLDPIAIFIVKNTIVNVDVDEIKKTYSEVEKNIKVEIEKLYETKCVRCKSNALILATIWDRDKNEPIEIRYYCKICKKRNKKEPDKTDLDLLKRIEKIKIPNWYPITRLAYNSLEFKESTHIPGVDSIDKLFTKRNLIALSILYNEIEKIKNKKIISLLKFAFTSMVHLASRMCPVAKPGGRGHWSELSATSFWAQHRYWLPPLAMESNVWMLFSSAILAKQGILKGKKDTNENIKYYREASKFDDLNDGADIFIKTYNALELEEIIPENCVDYIFTDPPYGGAVQYFELSTLWASWLKLKLDFKNEITINNNQDKDFEYYHRMLTAAFKQAYRVLKPGKFMTVTFHSTDIRVWTSIIKAVVLSGFDLEKIIYQPPARPSAKGLLQPYGSAVGDYYIRFKKPPKEKKLTPEEISQERYERIVVECAKRILAERGEPTIYQHILNGIIVELKSEGALLSGKTNPEDVMKKYLNKEFVHIDVFDETGKKIGRKWWLKDPSSIPYLELIPLEDRVETAIIDVLHRKVSVNFDDILLEIFIKFPNALTPETQSIRSILSEYADKTDGKWILKPLVRSRESQHSFMIYMLAILGNKAGYDIWIGQKEQGDSYKDKKLVEFCTSKDPTFRFIPSQNLDRIKQIDILWYKEGKIYYEFEIENTTAITEAIVRGSNIPQDFVKRYIVIPKERESMLYRKVKEPILKENVEKYNWKFISYKELQVLFEDSKRKKEKIIKELEKLGRMPEKKEQPKQLNLIDF